MLLRSLLFWNWNVNTLNGPWCLVLKWFQPNPFVWMQNAGNKFLNWKAENFPHCVNELKFHSSFNAVFNITWIMKLVFTSFRMILNYFLSDFSWENWLKKKRKEGKVFFGNSNETFRYVTITHINTTSSHIPFKWSYSLIKSHVRILTMKELFKREKLYQTIEIIKAQPKNGINIEIRKKSMFISREKVKELFAMSFV